MQDIHVTTHIYVSEKDTLIESTSAKREKVEERILLTFMAEWICNGAFERSSRQASQQLSLPEENFNLEEFKEKDNQGEIFKFN